MKRYFEHIKNTKTPHERRAHAMQVAGGVTALVALVWVTTLGFRFSLGAGGSDQTAAAANATNMTTNTLVVPGSDDPRY